MLNIEDMAKLIESEAENKPATPEEPGKETPQTFGEERAAEMIETALNVKTAEYAKQLESLTAEIAGLKSTIAAMTAEKGADNASN